MKKRNGIALASVVLVFFFISFYMIVMITYFRNNLAMTVRQQRTIRAHYYTQTGIELGTAVLYSRRPDVASGTGVFTLFEDFANGHASLPLNAAAEPQLTDTIAFQQDPTNVASPTVAIVGIDITRENRGTPAAPIWWVLLNVTTTLYDNTGIMLPANIIATDHGTAAFRADNPAINTRTR